MTASEIRYLLVLNELALKDETIRPSEVADRLNFSRSSISRMITNFSRQSFITREKNRTIKISFAGIEKANELKISIDYVAKQLYEKLESPLNHARNEAINIVGSLTKRTAEKLHILAKKNEQYYKNN